VPNWVIHNKWANKAGIDNLIANFVDRNIDYGTEWAFSEKPDDILDADAPLTLRQLKFFYKKDIEKKYSEENLYVKSFYLHHLLDFFKETRINAREFNLIFSVFIKKKIQTGFIDKNGKRISFNKELDEIYHLFQENYEELMRDLSIKVKLGK
jgi:hypothetical protein